MCAHDKFDVLYYSSWPEIVVRKCRGCGSIEIKIDGYASLEDVRRIIGTFKQTS